MYGAIIGDIAGSRFEFNNRRSKDFVLFHEADTFTDDSVMTVAVARALAETKGNGYEDLEKQLLDARDRKALSRQRLRRKVLSLDHGRRKASL